MSIKIIVNRGVSAPVGFEATGLACGIKASGKDDLGLVWSKTPAAIAAAFTTNKVVAAPVEACRENLEEKARAIIVNSGNANACSGRQGLEDAWSMIDWAAGTFGLDPHEVLVASTGIIGQPLPMTAIKDGIAALRPEQGREADAAFSRAIMTTDAFPKQLAIEVTLTGGKIVIGGAAKGAGMIAPNMAPHATMLAFVTTDAPLTTGQLSEHLEITLKKTFNAITVDGDMSTNDSIFAFANGMAGDFELTERDLRAFQEGLNYLCLQLAKMIVRDGEGATKLITYKVIGAKSADDAEQAARTVADSLLVKTAFFGQDPNWGRLLAAVGRAGVELDPGDIDIDIGGLPLVRSGKAAKTNPTEIAERMKSDEIEIWINLNRGGYRKTIYGCDLGHEYVKINAEYHT